ncbi:tight adherence protein B [Sphingomonas sp. PP-CE-3A-406]|jgi:tight adherence protein B|uniref:type II secretion system F family protein n=1 Tax=unclassified Sphingomonas TaxID=196159 RepID=UPI000EF887DC|nr:MULTISPECIES: type II secretion system F family protein [unclassified Sphingomonas]RMB28564.1 tight adherence protein B [Sphingomonas sp. PP-F2F-G114-C0414]RMB55889.1 tight adherence protein B [Sphingomonas sp. PP-CE-3A-406]
MDMLPFLLVMIGSALALGIVLFAFAGPSTGRAQSRRIAAVRERHGDALVVAEAQLRRISMTQDTKMDLAFGRILPNPVQLAKRLAMTGKDWTVGQYGLATAGIALVVAALMLLKGLPILLALLFGVFVGVGLPHFIVGKTIQRRIGKFTAKFPDAIDLLVRGLRSGLPISETIGVVGHEVEGPVGEEFRAVSDKMKIGRTMDAALQDTADRLGTPEFQFFVITIAIQRETGGNLAETLANLSHVLRQRGQMKLKIKAMSSESKASAYIIGALPFIVFGMIWVINGRYMQNFFIDERLMAIGMGGMVWMAIGAFIMSKMISFEI